MQVNRSSFNFIFTFGMCCLVTLLLAGGGLFLAFVDNPFPIESIDDVVILFLKLTCLFISAFTIRQLIQLYKLRSSGAKYFLVLLILSVIAVIILFFAANEMKGAILTLSGVLSLVTLRLFSIYRDIPTEHERNYSEE